MSGYGDERGMRPGSPSSERAAKPLAHALDTTLSILMDERIAGFAEQFESMKSAIDDLADRVAGLESDGLSKSIDERFSEAAAFHLSETERLMKQELETIERQIEGKASLVDLEGLEEKVEQMDKLFEEEVEQRHTEVQEVNEVLKGLEELFETRDAEYAEERRHKIESQLRKSIFHMKHRKATEAFNTWNVHVKKIRRRRHLLMMAVAQWRNRHLALYWRPWVNMFRHEHRARAEAAMKQIQDHHDLATKTLEDRIHGLTHRIDEDLLTDESLEAALKGIETDLHQKIEEHTQKLDEHADHLHAKVDDGHSSLFQSIDDMEAKLQQQSETLMQQLDGHAEELQALTASHKDGKKTPGSLKERLVLIEEALAHVLGLDLQPEAGEDYTVTVERTLQEFNESAGDEQEVAMRPVHGSAPARSSSSGSGGLLGQLKELQARMYAMEDNFGTEVREQIESNLVRVETLIKEEVETIELQIEGKTAMADLELLEEKVEEIDKLFEEEVEKRHREVHDVNEVLKGLEELFETRDAEYAEERRHKIESQLRKSIFHMKHRKATEAFNTWNVHVKKIRRRRHLLMMAVAQWRNRHLALYWRPWVNMFRHEHRARAEAAMKQIQDHHDLATKTLEDRIHGLTHRIDEDLLTDEVLEEALKNIQAQLHEKELELQGKMQEHADHLHAKFDDGHGNMSQSLEEMEAKLQQHSDGMVQQLDTSVTELREFQETNHAMLGEQLVGNHEQLVTWLGNKDKASVDSKMRSILFKMQHKLMTKAFVAWMQDTRHQLYVKRHEEHEGAIKQLHDMLSMDQLSALTEQVEYHDTTLKRLMKELGIKDINSYEAAGAVSNLIQAHLEEGLSEHERQRKEIHIDKLLRNVAIRWTQRDRARAFNTWAKYAKKQKRSRNLAEKCVRRMDNLVVVRNFLPWLQAARGLHDERQDQALDSFEARAVELKTDMHSLGENLEGTMAEQRSKWIEMTLRRVVGKWNKGLVSMMFEQWHKETFHQLQVRNMMRKTLAVMDNQLIAHTFGPWLQAARQLKEEKILAHTYEMHDQATSRLDALEQFHSDKHATIAQQVGELQSSFSQIQKTAAQDMNDMNDQLAAMHDKLEELGHIADVDRLQKDIEDRLEHLEVSLREEFQHVEVRCDIVSREFNRLCGKEWKDGLPPNKQPLDGLFAVESSAGRQLQELQQSMGAVKKETELLREFMATGQVQAMSPRAGGIGGEDADSLRKSVQSMEANVQKVFELKASVDNLQQQTESVRSKQEATGEAVAAHSGEIGGLKSQIETLASSLSAQAKASVDVAELKAGVSSVEREIGTMRNEQQQRGIVDADHSASIAGLAAELNALQQAHTQTQHATRDLQSSLGDTRGEVKASESTLHGLEQSISATKAEVADNAAVLEANLAGLDEKVTQLVQKHEQDEVLREQMESQYDAAQPEEGDPPGAPGVGSVMDELGNITRRIATLQMEQEVLGHAAAEGEDPEAAEQLEEVVRELSALEGALDQLGLQAGMSPGTTPSEYDDGASYDGGGDDGYGGYGDGGPARQLGSRRRPEGLRASRSRPSGPTDREAAWARAHAHAFGRASMRQDDG